MTNEKVKPTPEFVLENWNTVDTLVYALEACRAYMLGQATELDLLETDALAIAAITKYKEGQA